MNTLLIPLLFSQSVLNILFLQLIYSLLKLLLTRTYEIYMYRY
jgi:hypothetical protein